MLLAVPTLGFCIRTPVMADAQLPPSSRLAEPLTRTGCSSRLRITYPLGSHSPDQAHTTPKQPLVNMALVDAIPISLLVMSPE